MLELEELEEVHRVAGRRGDLEDALSIRQHEPGLRHTQELDATAREHGQEVDHVEVGHKRVRDVDKRSCEKCLP
jgi:hypothetical protein